MSKTITVTATWRSTHTIEVDDNFETNRTFRYLNDFPDEVLEEITSEVAELVDWEVS
jgi:hypothetical protein